MWRNASEKKRNLLLSEAIISSTAGILLIRTLGTNSSLKRNSYISMFRLQCVKNGYKPIGVSASKGQQPGTAASTLSQLPSA